MTETPPLDALVVAGSFRESGGYAGAQAAVEAGATALVVANDLAAIGALAALRDRGLRVPQDVSVVGYDGIPTEFTRGFAGIDDDTFSYTESSFRSVVDSTLQRAIALAEKEGGRRDGDFLVIRSQQPEPAPLDLWDDYGSPAERISIDDPRWDWRGEWIETRIHKWGQEFSSRASDVAGANVSIPFRGTGAILVGWYLPTGGVADIFLDGEPAGTIDVHPDEEDVKLDEAVWHAFDLADTDHELRLVVRGEPYRRTGGLESQGADIALTGLVVFRP